MTKRGRKSAAELAVAPPINRRTKPSAPASLTAEQGRVWDQTLAGLAPDWVQPEAFPVLEAYCRHVIAARRLAACISDYEISPKDFDIADYDRLLRAQERETRALSALAARLRLTPQNRYTAATAGRKPRDDAPRPWER